MKPMKSMIRIALSLGIVVAAAATPRVAQAQAACGANPNIILLVADDLGWEDLPFFASPIHWPTKTPGVPNDPPPDEEVDLVPIKKIRADWNLLAARMMADQDDDCTSEALDRGSSPLMPSWPPVGVAVPTGTPGGNGNHPTVAPSPFMVLPRDWEGTTHTYTCSSSNSDPRNGIIRGFGGLKRVAETGAIVSRFYTTAAVCGPSRFSFMTGRQGRRHGFGDPNAHIARKDETTIADLLREGDPSYRTAIFGKWHLGPPVATKEAYCDAEELEENGHCTANDTRDCCDDGSPWQSGFQYGAVYANTLLGHTVRADATLSCGPQNIGEYMGPRPTGAPTPTPTASAGRCVLADLHLSGTYQVPEELNDEDCGRDTNATDSVDCNNSTRFLTNLAIRFIQEAGSNPYFLVIQYPAVHNGAVGAPNNTKLHYRPMTGVKANGSYWGAIEELDAAIGRLLAVANRSNTVIFFTSDNGSVNKSYGLPDLRGGKFGSHEGGIRVGMVGSMCGDEMDPPVVRADDLLMSGVDLLPTILDAAGVSVPSGVHIDGTSFYDALSDAEASAPRDFAFSRQKKTAIMARQVDATVEPIPTPAWPPGPDHPTLPSATPTDVDADGVCAYRGIDPTTNSLMAFGASCTPCKTDDDCDGDTENTCQFVGGAQIAGCSKDERDGSTGVVTHNCKCNICVKPKWKLRVGRPVVPESTWVLDDGVYVADSGTDELFDLESNPFENRHVNCAKHPRRRSLWYDLRCRVANWDACTRYNLPTSCEPMTSTGFADRDYEVGSSCPTPTPMPTP